MRTYFISAFSLVTAVFCANLAVADHDADRVAVAKLKVIEDIGMTAEAIAEEIAAEDAAKMDHKKHECDIHKAKKLMMVYILQKAGVDKEKAWQVVSKLKKIKRMAMDEAKTILNVPANATKMDMVKAFLAKEGVNISDEDLHKLKKASKDLKCEVMENLKLRMLKHIMHKKMMHMKPNTDVAHPVPDNKK